MHSTGAEVAGTDSTLSRSGCRLSNDLSAFTATHVSVPMPVSTISRYLITVFLTVRTGGAETAADSRRRSYAAKSDERAFFASGAVAVSLGVVEESLVS